jgi:outer membrane protein assembly factor BamB
VELRQFLLVALPALLAAACAARDIPPFLAAAETAVTLAPAWSVELEVGGEMQLHPAPGGFLLVTAEGRLLLLEGDGGTVAWSRDLGARVTGPAALGEAGPGKGWVALPVEGGVALLTLPGGDPIPRWMSVGAGHYLSTVGANLLALSESGTAHLLDPLTGREIWSRNLGAGASAAGTGCREQILAGLEDGTLVGLDAATGERRWRKALRSPAAVAPACHGKHVFVATEDNTLHALRIHRGSAGRMWKVRSGADPVAPPLAVDKAVLFLSKDTYLYGLRRRNGHLVFRIRLSRRPGPAAVLDDLVLVAGHQATRLDAYRLPTGLNAGGFDLPVGSRFVTPPVVSGDWVAFAVARFGQLDRSRLIALAPRAEPLGEDGSEIQGR